MTTWTNRTDQVPAFSGEIIYVTDTNIKNYPGVPGKGWVRVTRGTGGRAGRTTYELLVFIDHFVTPPSGSNNSVVPVTANSSAPANSPAPANLA